MAWGFGGGGGGMFGGNAATTASRAGLPFGGIPEELMEEATKLLASEPVHPKSHIHFTQRPSAKERGPKCREHELSADAPSSSRGRHLIQVPEIGRLHGFADFAQRGPEPFLERRMVERKLQQRVRRFPPLDRPREKVGDVVNPRPEEGRPVIIPVSGQA